MKLSIKENLDIAFLLEDLTGAFPNYKVKKAPLNKKTLRVVNGMDQVVVGQSKGKLICVGNINMLDARIFIPFILLMALMIIGGIVFLIIMMQTRKKHYKAMEKEVAEYIQANII